MKKRKYISKIGAIAMAATIMMSSCFSAYADAETRTMKVNGKTVYISSTINTSSARSYTCSDSNVTVKVVSVYISAKNGKLASPVEKTKKTSSMAVLEFEAPSGAVSKSITSSHLANWNGAQVRDTTTASR